MTPFEKAGYTKDTKFKTLVRSCDLPKGTIVILYKDDSTSCPFFQTVCGSKINYAYYLYELELIVEQGVNSTNYPNPPHKHAELIKQWADGAEIEYYDSYYAGWFAILKPNWENDIQYRVKPQKSEKDIQIEKLEADFKLSYSKVAKSWEDYMQQTHLLTVLANKLQELKSNV